VRPYITAAVSLVFLVGPAWGQSQTGISQNTGGECSPAVVSQGKVTITCTGLDARQQEMLRKMPGLIDQLLKRSQSDRDEILAKLDEILKIQRDVEARSADRHLTDQEKTDLAKFLAERPKGRFTIKANITVHDARKYADEIAAFFTDKLGWNVHVDNAIITGSNTVGMWITVRDPNAPPSVAGILLQAFKAANMPVPGQYDTTGPAADEVWLSIGSKQ